MARCWPSGCGREVGLLILPLGAGLVIGIGNPLRGDDGAAWQLLAPWQLWDGVHLVQQLTPEWAAPLATVQRVLFVDAWLGDHPGGSELRLLQPDPDAAGASSPSGSHGLEPAGLLALAAVLYGAQPQAHLLLLPAFDFGHGTGLSPQLRQGLPAARRLLHGWLAHA